MRMSCNVRTVTSLQFYIEIIQSGEKLLNAYIYGLYDETYDIDKELYNVERLTRSFETFNQSIVFDHSSKVLH